jgi:RNA polymerase sigma-70 factor, ECF subfamily
VTDQRILRGSEPCAVNMSALSPVPEGIQEPDPELVALVEAARRGDRGSFTALHRRYVRLVRGLIMARRGTHDLEDRVQDVFAIALERLAQLRSAEAFGSWIAQIARREAKRRREPLLEGVLVDEIAVNDSPRAEAERLLAQIRSLPACYAEPLILRLVFGMSGAEIADELRLSPGYVRINLNRGMARLRLLLELHGGERK